MSTARKVLTVPLFLAACAGESAAPEADAAGPVLRLEGNASATAPGADDRVDCTFAIDILTVTGDGDGFTADSFGEVFRRSFDGDQPLFEFQALVAGELTLTTTAAGVEVRAVGDQPDDAKPFWLELEVITGTSTGDTTWAGDWTCAPILPGDPDAEDLDLDAPGTWTLAPT